jgi:hypothetical protein
MLWIYFAFRARLEPRILVGLRATTPPDPSRELAPAPGALIEACRNMQEDWNDCPNPSRPREDHGLGRHGQLNRSNDDVEFASDSRPALNHGGTPGPGQRGFAGSTPRLYRVIQGYWIFPRTP